MVRFLKRTLRSVIVRVELNWHSSLLMVTCPTSRAFFAAWLLAFPKSFASLVCIRKKKNNYATVNAKSHAGVGGRYWPRGLGALNTSPLSSLHNIYFCSVAVVLLPSQWVPVLALIYPFILRRREAKPIRHATIHFHDLRGAASLHNRNRGKIAVPICEHIGGFQCHAIQNRSK